MITNKRPTPMDIQTCDNPRAKIAEYLAERGMELHRFDSHFGKKHPGQACWAWFLQARSLWPQCLVWEQPFEIHLSGHNGFYVPDVMVVNADGSVKAVYHVHGTGWKHDLRYAAYQKARQALPEWDFQYARRTRQGWVLSDDAEDTYSKPDQGPSDGGSRKGRGQRSEAERSADTPVRRDSGGTKARN